MGVIINTNTREEYNNKINYYQMNGFQIASATTSNLQTRLIKKTLGPIWAQILLILSLIGFVVYQSELVFYALSISNLFIKLNFFSLVLATKYLRDIGIIFLILFIIMLGVILYYYFTKPDEIIVKLNQFNNNHQVLNNNYNNYNQNGGNSNG